MAHEIESNRFAYREGSEIPWHIEDGGIRDNKVPDTDCYSFERFMTAANMAVTYEKVPVFILNPALISVSGLFAIRRKEDGLILPNAGVGERYDILQPVEAFTFFQPFLDDKRVMLETAGMLRSGSRFFINASVAGSDAEVVPRDRVRGFLTFYSSVDGSLVTDVGFTMIRVVCANTARAAFSDLSKADGSTVSIRVKHTARQRLTLKGVQDILDFQSRGFTATIEQYRRLAQSAAVRSDVDKYVRLVLDFPSEADASTRANNIVESVVDLAETGIGVDIPGVRGTAWGAYNAMTEHLNHYAGRNSWTRADSLMFGEYAKATERALPLAEEVFVRR